MQWWRRSRCLVPRSPWPLGTLVVLMQGRSGGLADFEAVVVKHLLERLARCEHNGAVPRAEQRREFPYSSQPNACVRALDCGDHLGVVIGGLDRWLVDAARQIERSFKRAHLVRALTRGRVLDSLVDVVVEVIDRNQPIPVAVCFAALKPLYHSVGEYRGLRPAGEPIALVGVLHCARGCDHSPPAALKMLLDVDVIAGSCSHPEWERAAKTAVEHNHDPF